jgi:serine/threonine protein phosphatase PrpC
MLVADGQKCDVCGEKDAAFKSKHADFIGELLTCTQSCSDEFWTSRIQDKIQRQQQIFGFPDRQRLSIKAVSRCEKKNAHGDALACGEDAFFISEEEMLIGVADGVGGYGGTSSYTASCIMNQIKNSSDALERELNGLPRRKFRREELRMILEKAHDACKEARLPEGATTVTLAFLDQSDDMLHVLNLGDSGLAVVRNSMIIFHTRPQVHKNGRAPYQMSSVPGEADSASDAELYTFGPLKRGDYIVVGSDGVFDNITVPELSTLFMTTRVSGVKNRAEKDLGTLADKIVDFCRNAGRKPDDTTVVLARVYAL